MKNVQKCVRLTDRVVNYIEAYRGDNFSDKLQNFILDTEERRDELVLDWERLQAQIADKHAEMVVIQERFKKLRTVNQRLGPLVDALLDIIQEE